MKKNKKIALFFLLGLVAVIGIAGTYAYYTQNYVIPNQFKAATYDIGIEEEFYDTFGTKRVYIVNKEETNADVVLRLNYNESWRKGDFTLDNNINGVNVVDKNFTNTFTNDFILGDDGWYYYKKVLNAGERIQILESITKKQNLIDTSPYKAEYDSYDYELSFNYETIQAMPEAVSEIWGKTISINGGNVVWQ